MKTTAAIALSLLFAACAPRQASDTCRDVLSPPAAAATTLKIELLGFPGCPNTPAMRENLRAALKPARLPFTDVNQHQLPEGDPGRAWPAPTVLVNGTDLFGMAPPAAPFPTCRMYEGGVPGAAAIRERLEVRVQLGLTRPIRQLRWIDDEGDAERRGFRVFPGEVGVGCP